MYMSVSVCVCACVSVCLCVCLSFKLTCLELNVLETNSVAWFLVK